MIIKEQITETAKQNNEEDAGSGWNYHCYACGKSEANGHWRSLSGHSDKKFCSNECFETFVDKLQQKELEEKKEKQQTGQPQEEKEVKDLLNFKINTETQEQKTKEEQNKPQFRSELTDQSKFDDEINRLKKELQKLKKQQQTEFQEVQNNKNDPERKFPWLWMIVPMGAVILIFGGIILFLFRRKN